MNDKKRYLSELGSTFTISFTNKIESRKILLELTNPKTLERTYGSSDRVFGHQEDVVNYLKKHVETDGLDIRVIGI